MINYFQITHFFIGPVRIYTWGLFVGLAFTAGYFWLLWQGRKKGLPDGKIIILTLSVFLGAALGSRVLFLLQEPWQWLADVSLLWRIDAGGLMVWGGILGGLLAGWLYIKKNNWDIRQIADLAAPALALGIAIGRFGCFLVNDHQGAPTGLSWGILWPDGIIRQPVALYEVLFGLVMFGVLLWIQKRLLPERNAIGTESKAIGIDSSPRYARSGNNGLLFLLFLFSYALFRFCLDFLRVASGPLADSRWALGLTSSQWITAAVILSVGAVFVYRKMVELNK